MLKKSIHEIPTFLAGDRTILQELLHPKNDGVDLGYSLARALLRPDTQSAPHALGQSELYYFLQGSGIMVVGEKQQPVQAGDIVLVPADVVQYVLNNGVTDLEFLCIVSPPWTAEAERVF